MTINGRRSCTVGETIEAQSQSRCPTWTKVAESDPLGNFWMGIAAAQNAAAETELADRGQNAAAETKLADRGRVPSIVGGIVGGIAVALLIVGGLMIVMALNG
jgi:hypothetical protein